MTSSTATATSTSNSTMRKGTKNHNYRNRLLHPDPPLPPPPPPPTTSLGLELPLSSSSSSHHRRRRSSHSSRSSHSNSCNESHLHPTNANANPCTCTCTFGTSACNSKDTPASISTSPTSSNEEQDQDHEQIHGQSHEQDDREEEDQDLGHPLCHIPSPPPRYPHTHTPKHTPKHTSSQRPSLKAASVSHPQGSSTTMATTTTTDDEEEVDVDVEEEDDIDNGHDTDTGTEMDTINLLDLASITLASTIIASKVIQKHSKLFSSESTSSSSTSTSSLSSSSLFSSASSLFSSCSPNCSSSVSTSTSTSATPTTTTTTTSTKTPFQEESLNLQQEHPLHQTQPKQQQQQQQHQQPQPQPQFKNNLPKSRLKTNGTIVTDADGESQRIITSYIKSISPHIRIVGEESMDEIQKSHVSYEKHTKRHAWWGVSPGSRRRLMKREERDEDYICEFVKMEVYLRYNMYKSGYLHGERSRDRDHNCDDDDDDNDDNDDENDIDNHVDDFIGDECEEDEINVDPSRVSIFVDPLDGTSSYAKGNYEAVTILAGIMLDNVPIFGIIVKPFGHEGINVNFHKNMTNVTTMERSRDILGSAGGSSSSSVATNTAHSSLLGFHCPCSALYGGTLLGGAFLVSGSELDRSRDYRTKTSIPQSPSSSPDSMANRKAIISKSRGGGVVRECIDSLSSKGLLHPEPIYITGAGYKTLRLLLGTFQETMWFFPKPGTSLWDVAAADALLRCMGGRISDKFGKDLDYSKSWTDADNLDGIIASSDKHLHAKCLELYHNEGWDDE